MDFPYCLLGFFTLSLLLPSTPGEFPRFHPTPARRAETDFCASAFYFFRSLKRRILYTSDGNCSAGNGLWQT